MGDKAHLISTGESPLKASLSMEEERQVMNLPSVFVGGGKLLPFLGQRLVKTFRIFDGHVFL